jgi:undecaprenyl-diphosphatase
VNIFEAAFLGFIQAITEFLPISSSGHLVLFHHLFGEKEPQLVFDVAVHCGTLLAVFIYFWRDIMNLILDVLAGTAELLQGQSWTAVNIRNPHFKFFLLLIVASIPTGLMGIYFKDFFESLFSSLLAVGFGFWITTLIVWLTQFQAQPNRQAGQMKYWHALIVGIFQGIAITPGISRSGSTIAAGIFCGLDRPFAARFSFILSIPAILAASVLELKDAFEAAEKIPPILSLVVGTAVAAVTGYLVIRFLLRVLTFGHFHRFAYYTLGAGALCLILSLFIK